MCSIDLDVLFWDNLCMFYDVYVLLYLLLFVRINKHNVMLKC